MSDHDTSRFPIGPFEPRKSLTSEERRSLLEELAHFPADLRFMVQSLTPEQMDQPYREGGWTVRQVVHHLPDSHLHGYVRFKLAMTEDRPTIQTYQQAFWGETEDARRSYIHPVMGELNLDTTLQLYVWHGKHHLGHIQRVAGG